MRIDKRYADLLKLYMGKPGVDIEVERGRVVVRLRGSGILDEIPVREGPAT